MASDFDHLNANSPFSAWRDEFYRSQGLRARANQRRNDERAETQRGDVEGLAEAASGHALLNDHLGGLGHNPLNPWGSINAIGGSAIADMLLERVGERYPAKDTAEREALNAFRDRWNDQVVGDWGRQLWSGERLTDSLIYHRDPRSPDRLRAGVHGGLQFDRHLDNFLGVLASATDSLDVGMFMAEHPTALAAMHAKSRELGGKMRVRVNDPFSLAGRFALSAMESWKGMALTLSAFKGDRKDPLLKVVDHFKVAGANLMSSDLTERVVVLGSVNLTYGALGGGLNRGGAYAGSRGANVESSFVLHGSMIGRSMSRETFERLTNQAANAMEWVQRGGLATASLRATDFLNAGDEAMASRVLTGHGMRDKHAELIDSMGRLGGTAEIVTYNVGKEFLSRVKAAVVASKGQARFSIYLGARHDGSSPGAKAVRDAQAELAKLGYGDALSLTVNEQQLVHAKVSMFDVAGQLHAVYGSMNLDNSQWRGSYYDSETNKGTEYRNLGFYLRGDEYTDLGAERTNVQNVIRSGKFYKKLSAGYADWMTDDQWDTIQGLAARYGLTSRTLARTAAGFEASIGGHHVVGTGRNRTTVNLGELFKLSLVKYDRSFEGQYFVPELSKFINPAMGVYGTTEGQAAANGLPGPREADAVETFVAGVRAAQHTLGGHLNALANLVGGERLRQILADPFYRGQIRYNTRQFAKDRFRNFAGWEQGTPGYGAKAFARLVFGVDDQGRLDLSDDFMLDSKRMDASLTGRGFVSKRKQETYVNLRGVDFFWSAGGLSRFNKSGVASAARAYAMDALRTMPVTMRHRRPGMDRDEYVFLLPMTKIEQLPQRLQNLMSVRNLTPMDREMGGNSDLFATSLFAGEEGAPVRGIKIRGFAVPGMSGDNAYMVSDEFRGQYFGDEAWRKEAKMVSSRLIPGTEGVLMEDALNALIEGMVDGVQRGDKNQLARRLADGRILLTAEGLTALDHRLPLADYRVEDSTHIQRAYLGLGTDKAAGLGLILDFDNSTLRREKGRVVHTIRGTLVRELVSGDRMIAPMKAPYAFIQGDSWIVREMKRVSADALGSTHAALGLGRANAIFGTGVLKTGDAFVQTGLELIQTGHYLDQLESLSDSQIANLAHKDSDFTALFEKLSPFMDAHQRQLAFEMLGEMKTLDRASVARMLRKTQHRLRSGAVSMAKDPAHVAAAVLAFGIHATAIAQGLGARPDLVDALSGIFGDSREKVGLSRFNVKEMTAQQILSIVPMVFVGGVSASAVAMSSRDRINFLNYHSGGYTDAFLDLMAMSPAAKQRAAAYTELAAGGLLGKGFLDEIRVPHLEFDPMGHYVVGFAEEFAEITRITRRLQGHGTAPLTKQKVAELGARYREILAGMKAKLGEVSPLFAAAGSPTSAEIQDFLTAQEKAGIKARTLVVPILGSTDASGRFRYDPTGSRVQMRTVRLLSAGALKSLGSFEDYAHDIQRLQVGIERRLGVLRLIGDKNGRVHSRMGVREVEQYEELVEMMGELAAAQRGAAATDLQKVLGGQLAMSGHNMVAGTLPEIEHGLMIVGSEAWADMRANSADEMLRAARKAAKLNNTTVAHEVKALIRAIGAEANVDAARFADKVDERLAKLPDLAHLEERLTLVSDAIDVLHDRMRDVRAWHAAEKQALAESHGFLNRKTGQWVHGAIEAGARKAVVRLVEANRQGVATLTQKLRARRNQLLADQQTALNRTGAQLARVQEGLYRMANRRFNERLAQADTYLRSRTRARNEIGEVLDARFSERRERLLAETRARFKGVRGVYRFAQQFQAAHLDRHHLIARNRELLGHDAETAGSIRMWRAAARLERDATLGKRQSLTGVAAKRAERIQARTLEQLYAAEAEIESWIAELTAEEIAAVKGHADLRVGLELEALRLGSALDARRDDQNRALRGELEQLRAEHRSLKKEIESRQSAMLDELRGALGDMLDGDQALRAEVTRGLFQRAGAPMGPMGLQVMRIMTVGEYNAYRYSKSGNPHAILLDEHMARRSVFVSAGAMAVNLGDFDGDTASVGSLAHFAYLNSLKLLSTGVASLLDPKTEAPLLEEAKRALRYSAEETGVTFARHYTGWDDTFSDAKLYMLDGPMQGYTAAQAREHLHSLEEKRRKGLLLSSEEAALLDRFVDHRRSLHDLAVAANKYAADIYGLQDNIANKVRVDLSKGVDAKVAYRRFFESQAGKVAAKQLRKSLETVLGASGGGLGVGIHSDQLTANKLASFFVMTSYAATVLIGKVFEISYTTQVGIDAMRAQERNALARKVASEFGLGARAIPATLSALRDQHGPGVADYVAELEAIDERHASRAGILLVAQQMAREAIKPKSGLMIDKLRSALALTGDGDGVASGIELALDNVRTRGLQAIHAIIQGEDFGGQKVRVADWGYDEWKPGQTQEIRNEHGWDRAFHTIKDALVDYYAGQVESIANASGADYLDASKLSGKYLFEMKDDQGKNVFGFGSEAEADAFLSGLPEALKDASFDQQKKVVRAQLEHQAAIRAAEWIDMSYGLAEHRENRNDYMKAVDADAWRWNEVAGRISAEEKLQIIGASSARGKFGSPEALERALLDVFGHYDTVEDLQAAAENTKSGPFAENIAAIYKTWKKTGDVSKAFRRAALHSMAEQEDRDREMRLELEKAKDDQERKAVRERYAALGESNALLGEITRTLPGLLGAEETALLDAHEAMQTDHARFRALAESTSHAIAAGRGALATGALANVVFPALAMHGAGLAGAAAGQGVVDGGFRKLGETLGEFTAMSIGMANPMGMVVGALNAFEGREAITRAAIMATSFAAGAYAGGQAANLAGKLAVEVGSKYAGPLALAASAVAGFGVGVAGGMVLEALAYKAGLIKDRNPVAQTKLQAMDLESSFVQEGEELFDDPLYADGDASFVYQQTYEIIGLDGEVLGTEVVETSTPASRDAGAPADWGDVDAGLDTHVSTSSWEEGTKNNTALWDQLDYREGTM